MWLGSHRFTLNSLISNSRPHTFKWVLATARRSYYPCFIHSFIHSCKTYLDSCFLTPFCSDPHLSPLFPLGKWPYFWAHWKNLNSQKRTTIDCFCHKSLLFIHAMSILWVPLMDKPRSCLEPVHSLNVVFYSICLTKHIASRSFTSFFCVIFSPLLDIPISIVTWCTLLIVKNKTFSWYPFFLPVTSPIFFCPLWKKIHWKYGLHTLSPIPLLNLI